ncbi:hypothetical protein MN116_008815 [Schistosoma mekongi]|uniref:Uncharacterized protein n=1 Tax=Schistosoma mekongi TaxID=38744 RepID=A0AAE2D1D3_SCHME|nr:hypothetical protein MN116_008815 [Schistosoma mekongi]
MFTVNYFQLFQIESTLAERNAATLVHTCIVSSVPPEELLRPSACLAFIVIDHDLIMSNDLEGFVFTQTSLLLKPSNEKEQSSENSKLFFSNVRSQNRSANEYKHLQIRSSLIRPISYKYGALDVIGQRNYTYTQEIYKRWKTLEDSALN